MMKRRLSWLAVGSTLCGFVIVGGLSQAAEAATSPLVNESFSGPTTGPNWVLPTASVAETNGACITYQPSTQTTPVPACPPTTPVGVVGGLQLTPSTLQQEGGVGYSSSVPSSLGLDVSFNTAQYGGTGADGIVFYLAASDPNNAAASPVTLGPPGGYLSYSTDQQAAGLTHGYLGIGLDVYGNYGSSSLDGTGCTEAATGVQPEAVDVRGPGNGTAGYCLVNSEVTPSGTLESPNDQAVPVEVAINPTGGVLTASGGFAVPANSYAVQVLPAGGQSFIETGALPDATGFVPDPSWVNGNGVPQQLSFGWSAATGASTDYHTIWNVNVTTLNGTPPTFGVSLTDNSGGSARSGQLVNYTAAATLSGSAETRTTTLTDTFPAGLIPQTTGLGGTGWACTVNGQTVTCTTGPPTALGPLQNVVMPVLVSLPLGSPPTALADTATVGAPDATQGSYTDNQTYASAPTATALGFITQPVDDQVNAPMKNADGTTTHIQVGAEVTAGGAVDPTYTGSVTLGFGSNPGKAKFVTGQITSATLTATAVNGIADFSPIIVNTADFGYTLTATAAPLTSATSSPFDVIAAAKSCPAGQTCTVTATSAPSSGQTATIVAAPGSGPALITATYGGNVAPIHPCTGAVAGILTFSGNRQKTITLTIALKNAALLFCYGQPTPFRDITLRMTTYFSAANQEYEGLLPLCLPNFANGPCVKSISLSRTAETVVILSNAADPRIMS